MFVGILIAFAVIFIIVLAFKPNKKTIEVKRVDETGREIKETHTTKETSAAGCAAKIVVFTILGVGFLILIIGLGSM